MIKNNRDKKYKSISEVSKLLNINTHVIRYWDSKFDGISTRINKNKQRFFNFSNIKKIQDLQKALYQNGKHNYSLDLAHKIVDEHNNENLIYNKDVDKNRNKNIAKLKEIKRNLNKIVDSC